MHFPAFHACIWVAGRGGPPAEAGGERQAGAATGREGAYVHADGTASPRNPAVNLFLSSLAKLANCPSWWLPSPEILTTLRNKPLLSQGWRLGMKLAATDGLFLRHKPGNSTALEAGEQCVWQRIGARARKFHCKHTFDCSQGAL